MTALHLQVQRSEAQLRLAEAAAREQECRTKSAHAQGLAHAGALLAAARDARAAADEKCARLENELHARARAALGMQRRAVPPRRGTPRSRAAFRDFSVEVARAVGSEARACSRTLNSRGGGVQAPLDMQAPPAAPPAGEAVKRLEPREPPRHAGSGAPEQRTPAGGHCTRARRPGEAWWHGRQASAARPDDPQDCHRLFARAGWWQRAPAISGKDRRCEGRSGARRDSKRALIALGTASTGFIQFQYRSQTA